MNSYFKLIILFCCLTYCLVTSSKDDEKQQQQQIEEILFDEDPVSVGIRSFTVEVTTASEKLPSQTSQTSPSSSSISTVTSTSSSTTTMSSQPTTTINNNNNNDNNLNNKFPTTEEIVSTSTSTITTLSPLNLSKNRKKTSVTTSKRINEALDQNLNGLYRIKIAEITTDEFDNHILNDNLDNRNLHKLPLNYDEIRLQHSNFYNDRKVNITDFYPSKVDDFEPIIKKSNEKILKDKKIDLNLSTVSSQESKSLEIPDLKIPTSNIEIELIDDTQQSTALKQSDENLSDIGKLNDDKKSTKHVNQIIQQNNNENIQSINLKSSEENLNGLGHVLDTISTSIKNEEQIHLNQNNENVKIILDKLSTTIKNNLNDETSAIIDNQDTINGVNRVLDLTGELQQKDETIKKIEESFLPNRFLLNSEPIDVTTNVQEPISSTISTTTTTIENVKKSTATKIPPTKLIATKKSIQQKHPDFIERRVKKNDPHMKFRLLNGNENGEGISNTKFKAEQSSDDKNKEFSTTKFYNSQVLLTNKEHRPHKVNENKTFLSGPPTTTVTTISIPIKATSSLLSSATSSSTSLPILSTSATESNIKKNSSRTSSKIFNLQRAISLKKQILLTNRYPTNDVTTPTTIPSLASIHKDDKTVQPSIVSKTTESIATKLPAKIKLDDLITKDDLKKNIMMTTTTEQSDTVKPIRKLISRKISSIIKFQNPNLRKIKLMTTATTTTTTTMTTNKDDSSKSSSNNNNNNIETTTELDKTTQKLSLPLQKPFSRQPMMTRIEEKINSLDCDLVNVPSESNLWRGNETHELTLPILSPENCSSGPDCLPMIISWEGTTEIQSGDVLLVVIDETLLLPSDANKTHDDNPHKMQTAVYQVTRLGHEHCDVTEGVLLDITPLVVDGKKLVTLYDKDLTEGINLLIVVSESWKQQCVRLKVTVKSDNCGENAECSAKGICYSNASMEGYECQCCSGFAGSHCEEIDACTPSPCTNNGICVDLSQGHEGNSYQCLCPYGYTGKNCQFESEPCNPSQCLNGGTCVGNLTNFRCECAEGYKGPLCQHNLNECVSSPCYHGICVDQEDGFRCFCQPGFAGELCNFEFNECESNPCLNGGQCNDHIGSYSCKCTKGYTGKRCHIKVEFCANDPCPEGHRCVDHGDDFSCECPGGRNGPDCNQVPRTLCNINPCANGGTCWTSEESFYCACRPGFTGKMCEDDFVVETVVGSNEIISDDSSLRSFGDISSTTGLKRGPIELHNAYIAAGTLTAAIFIVAIIVTACHCKVHQTYRRFSIRHHPLIPIFGFGNRNKSNPHKHWLSGKGLQSNTKPTHLPSSHFSSQNNGFITSSTTNNSSGHPIRSLNRTLPLNLENDMYYTVDFSDSQNSPLIQ